jgi:hypothetical protein
MLPDRPVVVRTVHSNQGNLSRVSKSTAARAGFRARMRVKGTIDGIPFRSSLIPRRGGEVFVVVNSEMRARIGKTEGQTVRLELELDSRSVVFRVPPAFRQALHSDSKANAVFEALTLSQRLAYVRWIAGAKQDATRDRRVVAAIKRLGRGERFN